MDAAAKHSPPWVSLHAFYTRAHKNTWLPALCPVVPCLSCQPACTRICGRQSFSLPHIALPPSLLPSFFSWRSTGGRREHKHRAAGLSRVGREKKEGEKIAGKTTMEHHHGRVLRAGGGGGARPRAWARRRGDLHHQARQSTPCPPPRVRLCLSMKPVVLTVASSEA